MSATQTPAPRPVVVLACAGSDASQITQVVRALVERGAKVDLVPGIDKHVRPLERAVERYGDQALYVLCHSEALDRYQGDLLELTVKAGEVGAARLLSAWFDPSDAEGLTTAVARRLEQISSGAAPDPPPSPESVRQGSSMSRRPSASLSSMAASTLIAARAALGHRRAWRAFALAVALTALVTIALYFARIIG